MVDVAISLEERVRAIEDREGILHNLNQYVRSLDYHLDTSVWLDCFIENGVWWSSIEMPLAGSAGLRLQGHKELGAWFDLSKQHYAQRPEPRLQGKHIYTDIDIRVDGDRATSSCYYYTLANSEAGIGVNTMGRYDDKLIRCADGRWRFEERHLIREGAAPATRDISAGGFEKPGGLPPVGTLVPKRG